MPETKLYLHAATALQLSSWRYLFAFLRASDKAQARLKKTPGHVRHSLRVNPLTRTFSTYSIYEDYESLEAFLYSPEHSEAMAKMGEWSGPASRTTHWSSESREIDWREAKRRLAETPSYAERQARGRSGVQISG